MSKTPSQCPICGASRVSTRLSNTRDYITRDAFAVWQCADCTFAFTHPVPTDMEPYYPAKYRRYNPVILSILKNLYRVRVKGWARTFKTPGSALELGCGDGLMLDALKQAGWQVVGIERTPGMAHFARHELGLDIFAGELDALAQQPTFDLIILFQVLEHMPDPMTTLHRCARLLNPGGRLVIGVPNFASWQAQFGGDVWFHLDVPRHLNHFTPKAIERGLTDAGLERDEIAFVSFEHDPFGWVQTILNRARGKHNRLTASLMGMSQPGVLSTLIQLALAALLAPFAVILSLVSWAAGRGALMQVSARRRD